jgi:hypothetical protein
MLQARDFRGSGNKRTNFPLDTSSYTLKKMPIRINCPITTSVLMNRLRNRCRSIEFTTLINCSKKILPRSGTFTRDTIRCSSCPTIAKISTYNCITMQGISRIKEDITYLATPFPAAHFRRIPRASPKLCIHLTRLKFELIAVQGFITRIL